MKSKVEQRIIKPNNKRGMSLIVLVVTIVISLILIAITTISAVSAIDDANLIIFAEDLTDIQEAVEGYYVANNIMPTIDGSTVMTKDNIMGIARKANYLEFELIENDDMTSEFYTIDLVKINLTKAAYGAKKLGANDIFVISYPSMNVYYLYGIDAKNTTSFSITSKIYDTTKVEQDEKDTSTTSVITSGGITVTKNNGWANKMGVNIEVEMSAADEELKMSVGGSNNFLIVTTLGNNKFGFDLLSTIASGNETIEVVDVESNFANLATNFELDTYPSANRYVDILKYKSAVLIGKVRIDLTNFSKNLPTIITTSTVISLYTNMNTVKLFLSNSQSGIKEVRYEYVKKYSESGTIENYYTSDISFDDEYMKYKAKIAKFSDDYISIINLPKNVQKIKIALIDNAGNINMYDQLISPNVYVGYTIDSATRDSLQLTANMFSTNGILRVTFSISTNGISYSNEQVHTLNTTTSNSTTVKQCTPFTGITSDVVYVKIKALNYNSSIEVNKIIRIDNFINDTLAVEKINKPVLATGMLAKKWNSTTNAWDTVASPETDTSWYNYENKEWANAQTADGSMWVWIPRYIYKITSGWNTSTPGVIAVQFSQGTNDNWNRLVIGNINTDIGASASNNTWTNHPGFTFGTDELTGIWVAKFEASGTASDLSIIPGVVALKSITINDIFTACRNMETNSKFGWGTSGTGVDTHLIKNVEWGAAAYLGHSIYGKDGVEVTINATTSTGGGTASTYYTRAAQSTTGSVHGVYDMSGCSNEYTAAYVNNGNSVLTTNGSSLYYADLKYKDLYTKAATDSDANNYALAANKKGDTIYETSSSYSGSTSWYSGLSVMPNIAVPFFRVSGQSTQGTDAGTFSFNTGGGGTGSGLGFRPVLVVAPGI